MTETALQPMERNGHADEDVRTLSPRVDVFEKEDEFIVMADMPGVKPENVDVRFESGELSLRGRRERGRGEPIGYHRSFRIGEDVASDKIDANLRDGVLTLTLPKTEAVKPRRIAVRG